MSQNIKDLTVILVIAFAVYKLTGPIWLQFSEKATVIRRRNAWMLLTIVAFLSPYAWLYIAAAAVILIFVVKRETNPSALYMLLLHVIPSIPVTVPMFGISYLLEIDNYLLLDLVVLTPVAIRLLRGKSAAPLRPLERCDYLVLVYGVVTSFFYLRPEIHVGVLSPFTFTNALRFGATFLFSTFVPYFALSRNVTSRGEITEVLAAYCLGCTFMAAVACFEGIRHWLLYPDIAAHWGYGGGISVYVSRVDSIRAMASAGHSLLLGYLLAIAFGFWLYLGPKTNSVRLSWMLTALFAVGLISSFSRGPWLCAIFIYFTYVALNKNSASRLFKAAFGMLLVAVAISFTPMGTKIASVIPWLGGSVDSYNILYRQRLIDRSLTLIQGSPIFGDQTALLKMQDLRQGQGIIDLVNSYIEISLSSGLVGLSLVLSLALIALFRTWRSARRIALTDPDSAGLGHVLFACTAGTLLMMADCSFGAGLERLFYVLGALSTAYWRLPLSRPATPESQVPKFPPKRIPHGGAVGFRHLSR